MKNKTILVDKLPDGGYNVTVKQNRMDLLKAVFTGVFIINLDKAQAKILSKVLYVPVKKVYKPRTKPTTTPTE